MHHTRFLTRARALVPLLQHIKRILTEEEAIIPWSIRDRVDAIISHLRVRFQVVVAVDAPDSGDEDVEVEISD